jgi:tricarballylate dehydrogenase
MPLPVNTIAEYNARCAPTSFNPNVKDGRRTEGLAINKTMGEHDRRAAVGLGVTAASLSYVHGLRINTDAEVLTRTTSRSAALRGGELVGGIFYFNYPGIGLISGAVFGKIAGTSAGCVMKK